MLLFWVLIQFLCYSVQNQAFYRTGIFENFFFGGGEFCVFKTGIPGGPAQPYDLAKKSLIYTNRNFPTRFPTSPRWSSYVAPKYPKGAKRPISVQNRTSLEESLLQSFFVWKLSAKSCKAFTGLTICEKMTGGGNPFYLKFWVKVTALERNRRFSIYFRS